MDMACSTQKVKREERGERWGDERAERGELHTIFLYESLKAGDS
jgi:hypothetical protein